MSDTTLAPVNETGAAPQRRIELPGIFNLRDVGGYPTTTGSIRWRALLRSDAPARVGETGVKHLADAGVTRVVDLRSDDERLKSPSDYAGSGIVEIHVPVHSDAAPKVAGTGAQMLATVYELMVDESGLALVEALRGIAEAGPEGAALVHCTAGKDRTGVVIAMALELAGVDREIVLDDYTLSQEYLAGEWAAQMRTAIAAQFPGLPEDIDDLLVASPRELLAATLDRVEAAHGSVRDYLIAHGMTAAEIDTLISNITVPATAEEAS
ncbi:tyrosine-protein phosphatase [Demequina flava]|uniref:tyrosine-protein phosphatase n=1 Tax=Demequina flava TaxID=1095025 RepID=UPI00078675FA|nr:tyrosine-protein phosphatase [Demequina flava]